MTNSAFLDSNFQDLIKKKQKPLPNRKRFHYLKLQISISQKSHPQKYKNLRLLPDAIQEVFRNDKLLL